MCLCIRENQNDTLCCSKLLHMLHPCVNCSVISYDFWSTQGILIRPHLHKCRQFTMDHIIITSCLMLDYKMLKAKQSTADQTERASEDKSEWLTGFCHGCPWQLVCACLRWLWTLWPDKDFLLESKASKPPVGVAWATPTGVFAWSIKWTSPFPIQPVTSWSQAV